MNKRVRRPSVPAPPAESALHARERRLGEVIDGEVPTTDEEWALVDTLATLRGEPCGDPPLALVAAAVEMARSAAVPARRRSAPGALVSWARRRLDRRRGGRRRVGLIARSASRRASRSPGDRR